MDTMRTEYRELTVNEKCDLAAIKAAGNEFVRHLDTIASHYTDESRPARELALAKTNVEQAVMWASKGITA